MALSKNSYDRHILRLLKQQETGGIITVNNQIENPNREIITALSSIVERVGKMLEHASDDDAFARNHGDGFGSYVVRVCKLEDQGMVVNLNQSIIKHSRRKFGTPEEKRVYWRQKRAEWKYRQKMQQLLKD